MKLGGLVAVLGLLCCKLVATSIDVEWQYQGVPEGMRLFEVGGPRRPMLWETGQKAALEALPVGQEIKSPVLEAAPGSKRRFVLVYHNPTDKPVYFFAAPHAITPAPSALGVKFKCLCVNRAYEVPAGHYWYRVVELRISKGQEGDKVLISHQLLAVTKKQMEEINLAPEAENGHSMDGM